MTPSGIDPDLGDWGFPDEDPRCIAQRYRENCAEADLASHNASRVGFEHFYFCPSLNPDSPEGETINTLYDGIKEIELMVADLLKWFPTIGVHPDKDPTKITQRP